MIDAYEKITNQIIEALESNEIPWRKPWGYLPDTQPRSITGRPYNGFNRMWLSFVQAAKGYGDPRWLTFNQARNMGGSVRKGEKSQAITLWTQMFNHKLNTKCKVKKVSESCENGCPKFGILKYYSVFNVAQVDGLNIKAIESTLPAEFDAIAEAEAIVDRYCTSQQIEIRPADHAFYSPSQDFIGMPLKASFTSREGYYSTVFHEMGHSTGHPSRLARKDGSEIVKFGDEKYAREELVAEMTSAFVNSAANISCDVEDTQRVAYIQSWLRALKNDKTLVVSAAAQAQKAADMILS